jgi:hypothetical protein
MQRKIFPLESRNNGDNVLPFEYFELKDLSPLKCNSSVNKTSFRQMYRKYKFYKVLVCFFLQYAMIAYVNINKNKACEIQIFNIYCIKVTSGYMSNNWNVFQYKLNTFERGSFCQILLQIICFGIVNTIVIIFMF